MIWRISAIRTKELFRSQSRSGAEIFLFLFHAITQLCRAVYAVKAIDIYHGDKHDDKQMKLLTLGTPVEKTSEHM